MKNAKSIKGNFIAKFFSGFVFVISSFITLFCTICIVLLTSFGAFDSSREATINSMRDSIYFQVIQNYSNDALDLCVFGDKSTAIFDDTNFRFRIVTDSGMVTQTSMKFSDGEYIYKTSFDFPYPMEYVYSDTDGVGYGISTVTYTIECYVDGNLDKDDQFAFLNDFITIMYNLRFVAILICLLGAFATIASFIFLMCSAGYYDADEAPGLSWFDKISLEFIIGALLLLGAGELYLIDSIISYSISAAIWSVFIVLVDITLMLLVCMSLVARIHCKSFWKTTLVYTILRTIFLLFKKMFTFFIKVLSYVPALWRLIFAVALFCIIEFILLLVWGIEDVVILFVLEKMVFIPVIFYVALVLYKLENTGKQLASGDMTATVDTRYFVGTLKKQGNHLNSIKLGISQAVEDKMKSERFKTELITNVSHDIKTPLTSIINYVDLLDKEDLQNETAKEYIKIISKHSDRLKKLVVDLVDASKASSGVLKLNMQPMKIDVLLEQIAGEYTERLAENNLELIMRKPEESIHIMADGQRIYRVFDNLMNNIYKYALPGTRVYLLLEKEENKTIISFKNISASELDMSANDLMERFVRGDKSRNTEGSGLGLSIAESLTRLQNGEFRIQLDGDLFKIVISFPIIEENP